MQEGLVVTVLCITALAVCLIGVPLGLWAAEQEYRREREEEMMRKQRAARRGKQ